MQVLPDINMNVIEKWEHSEKHHEQNRVLKGSEDFVGPSQKRVCTDIFALISFIILNCGLIGLVYYIYTVSNISRLGHGSDFRGDVCGVSNLSKKEFTYFPNPQDISIVLCISSCPSSVVSNRICYYDTDGVTELPVWGCWDSIPSTKFAYYCLPADETYMKPVLNRFFTPQNLITRAGGDVVYVNYS